MTKPNLEPKPTTDVTGVVWSSETRSWVSLLLFAHLFAVAVAVTSYTRPSSLQQRLHELFSPYLRNLHLTAYPVSYPFARFYFTHAQLSDVDFKIEVDVPQSDGSLAKQFVPANNIGLPIRVRRYQAIANAAGTLAELEAGDDNGSALPRAVAGALLKSNGASEGTVRVKAHFLPDIEAMSGNEATRTAALANYRDVYEAQVFVTDGKVEIVKKSSTLEIAPVRKPPAGRGAVQP